ncbi:hypothetical protein ABH922_005585 [Rhodococcus sp. 27YEA15]|uniref:hypothetical protein n=1 Tax=Rhodococcus sp. 27YEA15 TaxID=3156259 RepID=UPI003C7B84B3
MMREPEETEQPRSSHIQHQCCSFFGADMGFDEGPRDFVDKSDPRVTADLPYRNRRAESVSPHFGHSLCLDIDFARVKIDYRADPFARICPETADKLSPATPIAGRHKRISPGPVSIEEIAITRNFDSTMMIDKFDTRPELNRV